MIAFCLLEPEKALSDPGVLIIKKWEVSTPGALRMIQAQIMFFYFYVIFLNLQKNRINQLTAGNLIFILI